MKKLLLAALLLGTAQVRAGEVEPLVRSLSLGTLLSEIALNGAAGVRTFTVGPTQAGGDLRRWSTLVLNFDYTWANNGTISIVCTSGATTATATRSLVGGTVSSGTWTIAFAGTITTPTLTASKGWGPVNLGIAGAKALSCVVSHGGAPNANDKITVTGELLGSGV